jgi:hypothetical protein
MSPEQAASAAALARLREEMKEDRAAMARRIRDLDEAEARLQRSAGDPAAMALAAWALHGWYTALETLLERVARQIDCDVPEGDRWHRELLSQMVAEVPGLRPSVIPREERASLESLLAFRHFVRHAYGVDLDAEKLGAEARRLRVAAPAVSKLLDAFDAFLDGAGRAASH